MIYKLRFVIILLFLFFLPVNLFSNNYFDNRQILDKNNNIGQPVFSLALDANGFVWISSRSVISRYDGRNIKYYSLTNTDIVSDNQGRQIFLRKDSSNHLWAFTDSGKIYKYEAESDSFQLFFTASLVEGYLLLNDIFWDEVGNLWMATSGGLACHSSKSEVSKGIIISVAHGLFITTVVPISESILALGTNSGLIFFDLETKKILDEVFCENEHITAIYQDKSKNTLWIGTFSSGLYIWDIQRRKDITPDYIRSIPHVPVKVIKYFDDDNLLVGLDGRGVYEINTQKNIARLFFSDKFNGREAMDDNGVYDILIDKKNIWIGTYTGGLTVVKEPGMFDWIRHIPYNKESLMNGYIHTIYEDRDGDLWYATKAGVSCYNKQSQKWKHYFEGENTFLTITQDALGNIWCGGFSTGIYCINKKTGNIRHIRSLKNIVQADCIYASALDTDMNLWFGGLYNPLTCISKDSSGKETFSYFDIYQVNSISSLNRDTLFIGTTSGFYLLNRTTKESSHHFADPNRYGVKSNSFVYTGIQVNDNLWFGTDGGGLNCFNLSSGKFENFSTYDGLPSNYIYGIVKDEKDQLWISTNKGLFTFDPIKKMFLYNIEELPVKQFVFNSFSNLSDGTMAFGSRNGVIIFNPTKAGKKTLSSNLLFTDFRLFYNKVTSKDNPEILSVPIDKVECINLDYNQNTFSFDFITIDLYDPGSYIYEYKLEGFDNTWVSKGNALTADYMNVAPGKYIFNVRCKSSSGGEILATRNIDVTINQPYWNTIWAWILYFAVSIVLIYWGWNYYKEKLQKKQSEEKIDFFVNIAHDIRTPLSLVIAPLNDLEKDAGLSAKAQSYLKMAIQNSEKLLSIVTQLLDFQKVENNPSKLELSICDFTPYLKTRVERFEILAHTKSIHLEVEINDDEVMLVEIDIKKMDRILDNLLSNAIKYTGVNGKVYVRLQKKDKKLILEIEDNGIGISKSEQSKIFRHYYRANNAINSKEGGSGIGLVFTKRLVELMIGDLSFSSQENVGTTFTLSLPLKESVLSDENVSHESESNNIISKMSAHTISSRLRLDSYRILLVEDNDDMRNYLLNTLSASYNIEGVDSAEDAMGFLHNHTVDLVISDIMMPGMNGNELCRLLKSNIETSHIQVILLTALVDKSQMLIGLEYGADDYITKPFDIEVLKIKIHNFMNTRKKLQHHYLTLANLKEMPKDGSTADEMKGNIIDDDFLKKCIDIVVENISNTGFTINDMCRELAMSRTLVYEKMKILTDQSPNEFIRSIRMKQAKEFLLTRKYTVQEVSVMTGFSDSKYFSTVFKRYYGESPSKI